MDSSKIISKSKRGLSSDGFAYDATVGPWSSTSEYENFILNEVGVSSIKAGTNIQVWEVVNNAKTGGVINYQYNGKTKKWDVFGSGSSANISVATASADGLMSKTDKSRLDTLWQKAVLYDEETGSTILPSGGSGSGSGSGSGLSADEIQAIIDQLSATYEGRIAALEAKLGQYSIVESSNN